MYRADSTCVAPIGGQATVKCHWTGMNSKYSIKTAGSLLLTRRLGSSNSTINIALQRAQDGGNDNGGCE